MKEYQSREYCRDIKCTAQRELDSDGADKFKQVIKNDWCKSCKAYKFHQWLKDNGYKIVKEECLK